MQSAGTYISGAGHVGLVVWLVLGWGFASEPLPFEIADVSVVTGEEFAALQRATTPDPETETPIAPAAPAIEEAPEPPVEVEAPEPAPLPEEVEPPVEETAPPDAPEPPAPVADVTDEVPEITSPDLVEQPEISEEIVTDTPNAGPAQVISPSQVPQPQTDAPVSVDTTPAVRPEEPTEEAPAEEPEETTSAPDSAQTTSVENLEVSGAPETSIRPAARPRRPTPEPEPEAEVAETQPSTAQQVEDVLAGIDLGEAIEQGPPMTGSERDAFRVAVNACWVVDTGAASANVTVEVAFSLSRDGKVESGPTLVSASGGSDAAQRAAFESARRAILRCQSNGYELPADKYGQWKDVVIEFDPSGMRLR